MKGPVLNHFGRKTFKLQFKAGYMLYIVVLLCLSLSFLASNASAATGVNKQIKFQGELVDENVFNVASGSDYEVKFSLYNASSAETNIRTETKRQAFTVIDGILGVSVGSVTEYPIRKGVSK